MNVDVPAHIERLLFLHDTLVIPGLGGFTTARNSATVDYATGTINPPLKTLTFSEHLTVDDGILIEDIAQTYGLSTEEARQAVEAFVEQVQQRLDQRDIVSLPGVGRLYKNYLQKVQFLPDTTNFSANTYGLPPLQFSPIARAREMAGTAEAGRALATTAAPEAEVESLVPPIPPLPNPPAFDNGSHLPPRSSAGRFGIGIGIGLILCSVLLGLWWWQHRKDVAPTTLQEQLSEMERARPLSTLPEIAALGQTAESLQAPTPQNSATSPPDIEESDIDDEMAENSAERRAALERLQKESQQPDFQPPSSKSRRCVLIVATLSNPDNADRLVGQLKGAGYIVYEHTNPRGRQIGISFFYTDPGEIEQKKAELTRLTGEKNIFIKSK